MLKLTTAAYFIRSKLPCNVINSIHLCKVAGTLSSSRFNGTYVCSLKQVLNSKITNVIHWQQLCVSVWTWCWSFQLCNITYRASLSSQSSSLLPCENQNLIRICQRYAVLYVEVLESSVTTPHI